MRNALKKIKTAIASLIFAYFFYFVCITSVLLSILTKNSLFLLFILPISLIYLMFSDKKELTLLVMMPLALFTNFSIYDKNINFFHVISILLFIYLLFFLIIYLIKNKTFSILKRVVFFSIPTFYGILLSLINTLLLNFNRGSISLEIFVATTRDGIYMLFPFLILIFLLINKNVKKSKNSFDYFRFFLITFTISSLVAFIIFQYDHSLLYTDDGDLINLSAKRFNGFDFDPNYFSLYAIFFNLMMLNRKNDKLSTFLVDAIFLIITNLLALYSGSKMFLSCLIIFLVLLSIRLFKKNKKIFLILATIIFVFAICFLLLFGGVIMEYIDKRIINNGAASYGGGLLSSITTGRTIIFADYADYILKNPLVFMFGLNAGISLIDLHAVHNTFGYTVYNYGFFVGVFQMHSLYVLFFSNFSPTRRIERLGYYFSLFLCLNSLNFYFSLNAITLFSIVGLFNYEQNKETAISSNILKKEENSVNNYKKISL